MERDTFLRGKLVVFLKKLEMTQFEAYHFEETQNTKKVGRKSLFFFNNCPRCFVSNCATFVTAASLSFCRRRRRRRFVVDYKTVFKCSPRPIEE